MAVTRFDWVDTARQRHVPVKIYLPEKGAGPFPVIVFSHGLGGSREAYEYLGRHWASYGYVIAHIQHEGSDDQVWKGQEHPGRALQQAAGDVRNAIAPASSTATVSSVVATGRFMNGAEIFICDG